MASCLHQCYAALSNPSGVDVTAVTNQLIEIYRNTASFGVLLSFITECPEEILKIHAVIGLGQCIKMHIDQFQGDLDVINGVFSLCAAVHPIIRGNALFYLRMLVSSVCAPHCLQLVRNMAEGQDETKLIVALNVLPILLPHIPDEQLDLSFMAALVEKGLKASSDDNRVAACCLQILLIAYIPDAATANAMLSVAVASYQTALATGSEDGIGRITRSFQQFLENVPEGVDVTGLVGCCLECLGSPGVRLGAKNCAVDAVDSYMSNAFYDSANPDIVAKILEQYIQFCMQTYDPGDEFETSHYDMFDAMSGVFSESDQLLSHIWSLVPVLCSKDSSGRFTALCLLLASFLPCCDFFAERGSDICNILQGVLCDSDSCVKSTAAHCIVDFCQAVDYVEVSSLVEPLISGFQLELAAEFLDALTAVFDKLVNTDPVFDRACEFLFGLIQRAGELFIQQKAIHAIASLTKHSIERIYFHFEIVFPVMMQVIDQGDEALKPAAVECLAHCCESCPEQMTQYVPKFIEYLVSHLDAIECIDGFGLVCEAFSEIAQPFVERALKTLLETAQKDIDSDAFVDGPDDDHFGFEKVLSVTAASIRVTCQVLHVFHQLIPQLFSPLLGLFEMFRNSESGDGTLACANGCYWICDAISQSTQLAQYLNPMLNLVKLLVRNSSDAATAGAAFKAMAAIYQANIPLDGEVISVILMALRGELFFQRGMCEYDESLHTNLAIVLRQLLSREGFLDVINKELVPVIQNLCKAKGKRLQRFALSFLGEFTMKVSASPETKTEIMNQALAIEAFDCISYLIDSDVAFVQHRMEDIVQCLQKCLTSASSRESEKMMLLICHLVMTCNIDPTPFIDFLFRTIPPQLMIGSTNKCLEFLLWIIKQQNEQWKEKSLICLVKILGETPAMIGRRYIAPELLAQAKASVSAILSGVQDATSFCTRVFEGDAHRVRCFERNMAPTPS